VALSVLSLLYLRGQRDVGLHTPDAAPPVEDNTVLLLDDNDDSTKEAP
jgi:hypothetical protein